MHDNLYLIYESKNDFLFALDRDIVGECSVSFRNGPLYIEWIEVYEPFRNKGLLRRMLSALFARFPNEKRIEFYSKYSLVHLYEHLGAKTVKVVNSQGSADMVLFANNLTYFDNN